MIGVITKLPALCLFGLVLVFLVAAGNVSAQQQSLSVEELEAYIEKKKNDLAAAQQQRELTAEKQRLIAQRREAQKQRQIELENELRELCAKRETTNEGAAARCLQEFNIQP